MEWPVADAVPALYVLADQWYRERVALREAGAKRDDPVGDSIDQAQMQVVTRAPVAVSDRLAQVQKFGGEVG